MCGIAGVFRSDGGPVDPPVIARMSATLAHRGPDGGGAYVTGHVGLAHRRLAIIDLSAAAEQPMANEDGTVVIVFNGEIFNYQKLRTELIAVGHEFHSQSDTEVIVHGYEEWGVDVVEHIAGMFAFAIWDAGRDRMLLARDRLGIKPLYFTMRAERLYFGSEIKAIIAAGAWTGEVDPAAFLEYFTFQNVLSNRTLFAGVEMLPAGHIAVIERGATAVRTERYWDHQFVRADDADISEDAARVELRQRFDSAVGSQLMSDVPLGSYLSGGMDSGSLVAVASQSIPHLMTFTGGFDLSLATGIEQNFDEREAAERMAAIFHTDHYEMVLHGGSMERVLPRLVWHLEDLRVGMSYQNFYIAQLASKFVKVVLSGAGGDEMFAGYPWRYAALMGAKSVDEFDRSSYKSWQRLIPEHRRHEFFTDEILQACVNHSTFEVFQSVFAQDAPGAEGWSEEVAVNRELYFELKTFLHGLLVVEDKLSSAHALETRVPFLDNDLVEFANRLPVSYKLNLPELDKKRCSGATEILSNDGKVILRQTMLGLVPQSILSKQKQGFSTPDASWYRTDSMDYLRELLLSQRALSRGYFKPQSVRAVLDEHVSGAANHRLLIWSFACFEWWNRIFVDGDFEAA